MTKKKDDEVAAPAETAPVEDPDPCTCAEVEREGLKMPCPSCKAKGLSGYRGQQ